MAVYLITIGIIIGLFLIREIAVTQRGNELQTTQKNNKTLVFVIFLVLAFVAAFRYGVGTDFYAYYKTKSWTSNFERENYNNPGFTLFSIICSFVFGGINGSVTIGAALVTVFLFVFTIGKRADNLLMSILLFILAGVFTGMFNGVRQYLATAILFAGHHFIIDKKPMKWLVVVLIASSMHVTAILMFFVYFVCNLECSWKLVFMYMVIAVVLLFAYEPLFNLIGTLKQDEIDTSDVYMSTRVNILRIAVQVIPICIMFFLDKDKINEDKETRFLFNICLLNAAIAVAAMNSAYLSRFWIYTSCFQMLMYPKLFSKMDNGNKALFTAILLFGYAIFWGYEVMHSSALSTFRWIFKYL